MTLGQSIRGGVKWLAFGKLGNRLFATIHIFTGFVGMFTAGGMGQSLIRAKQVDPGDFTAVFTLQLAVGVLVYLGFFLAAPLVAHFFDNPLYTDLVRISALSFLLRPLVTMRNAWLNREMQFKSRTLVDVATALVGGIVSVCMAVFGMGVWSLTISGLLGALFNNFWLARLTPLKPRLNIDIAKMRKHAGYGAGIVGVDFVNYLHGHSRALILSKAAGPAFLGLFNKAESLSRLPNQLLMSPTMEPLFRAMSKTQDDLDQTKYMFYRAITLLMAYTTPVYVLLWWIAESFVGVVYGPNWIAASAPMSILTMAGVAFNVAFPCSVLLAAQNQLGREMWATAINLPILAFASFIGLRWGLEGVACAVVLCHVLFAAQVYGLVLRTIDTRVVDLCRATVPGLLLGALLFGFLALVDHALGDWQRLRPAIYLVTMAALGCVFAVAAFLWLPLPALRTESARWRELLAKCLRMPNRPV
jgi:teichuronic acid exporter